MQVWLGITQGTVGDCTQAQSLAAGLPAQYPVADGGFDAKEIVADAIALGMEGIIPLRSRRKDPRNYYQDPHRLCHLVENAFLNLKQRGRWQLDMPKTPPPSWQFAKSEHHSFGQSCFDDST